MEVSKKSLNKVLRAVYSGKIERGIEDIPKPVITPTPKEAVPPRESDNIKIINRIYFYTIDPNKKISFANINDILTGSDNAKKEELLNNLKSGNTADYHADYFKWDALYVKAQEDDNKFVVYAYDLNPWGTKSSEGTVIRTEVAGFNPPSPQEIAKDSNYGLFGTINEIPDMVSLGQGPDSIYSTDKVSDQFARRLLAAKTESTVAKKMNYESFKANIFSYYRIWIPITTNELRNVDGSRPITDQLPPTMQAKGLKHYKGGGGFFKKFMEEGKYKTDEEEKPEIPGETTVKKPIGTAPAPSSAPEFTPVTKKEPKLTPVTREATIIEINKDDPRANQYIGDFSIMQDLVKRQLKKMKIRKKEAEYSMSTTQTGTQRIPGKAPSKVDVSIPIGNVNETRKVTKKVEQASKNLEQLNKDIQQGRPAMPGTMVCSSQNVKNVLNKFFKF